MSTDRKTLWITGAGSGMGRAAALSAARAGWNVALSGRRPEQLAESAALAREEGADALILPLDARDGDALRAANDTITSRFGALDALVLSAGLNDPKRTWGDQRMASFEAIVETNLTAVARAVDIALPSLRSTRGTVVVVSSYAGWSFSRGAGVAYSASKTALASVCRTLNVEEGASGVRACHLCPGDVATDFLEQRPQVPDATAREVMLTPADIGRAVQFVLDSPAHVRIDELVISPVSQR